MTINFKVPEIKELKPRILVLGVGGAGGNAINEMIDAGARREFVGGHLWIKRFPAFHGKE